jgi:NAD-dependent DNA ligase
MADSIVAQLQAASDAYYNGKPLLMNDDEFDALVEKLRAVDPKNPFFKTVGAAVGAGAVKLPYLMPSLDKIKPGEDSLRRFLAGQAFVVSEKLDGLSALWSPSKKQLYLRGDGVEGQDISHLTAIQGLRADGKAKFGVVRGEIVLSRSQTVKGPARSWVNGLIHQISPAASEVAKLRFVAYEVLFPSRLSRSAQFAWLEEAGYETPWHVSAATVTEEALKAWLVERRAQSAYDTDGIVIGYDAVTEVKTKALKNPKDCVAFKMPLADQKAVTKVLAVEWNTSAQGYLIPRIQFEPVTIGGAVIQYCTGHNARAILTGGVGPGAMICIRRSGDVIPTLESVVTPAVGGAVMPAGVWDGNEATAAHMRMATGTTSKELVTSQMGYFLKKLEIPGAGPSTWKELVDAGIDTPKKLWDTGAPRLSEILGPKTGATLHASLRTAFAKVDEQTLMIASSLMPRSVGETKLKSLFEAEADPRRWTALTVAPESWSADSLKAFQAVYPQYEAWRQQITWVAYPILKVAAAAPTAAKGKVESICFTGFRDKDLEAKLVAAGHVIHGAVTGKTTILVTPDDGAETEKIKKARATGVRVLKKSEAALL